MCFYAYQNILMAKHADVKNYTEKIQLNSMG